MAFAKIHESSQTYEFCLDSWQNLKFTTDLPNHSKLYFAPESSIHRPNVAEPGQSYELDCDGVESRWMKARRFSGPHKNLRIRTLRPRRECVLSLVCASGIDLRDWHSKFSRRVTQEHRCPAQSTGILLHSKQKPRPVCCELFRSSCLSCSSPGQKQ